jgi:hypothetical protein
MQGPNANSIVSKWKASTSIRESKRLLGGATSRGSGRQKRGSHANSMIHEELLGRTEALLALYYPLSYDTCIFRRCNRFDLQVKHGTESDGLNPAATNVW